MNENSPDSLKRRLKEFRKIQETGTTTEYDNGFRDAQREFLKKMVFMLSKHFQSIGNRTFITIKPYTFNTFVNECYDYLREIKYYSKKK